MNFFDQYKHPNWQKKRLEVLESADFTCERCYDSDSQLHVHHKRYVNGRKIWEYDRTELAVLCDSCHAQAHSEKDVLQALITAIPVNAVPEITALIANYCSETIGPCREVDFSEFVRATTEEPFASVLGKAAAVLGNRCSIAEIMGLSENLAVEAPGASVAVFAKTRPEVFNDSSV